MNQETQKITMENGSISFEVDILGAEAASLRKNGLEYLWQGDPAFWSGRAPVLFPIVGALRDDQTLIEGEIYSMPRHGFARRKSFYVEQENRESAVFTLEADEETHKQYPFDFTLHITYRLDGDAVIKTYTVENRSEREMPFVIGGHPGFRCPLVAGEQFSDYVVEFEREETLQCPAIDMKTGIIDYGTTVFSLSKERRVPLRHELFDKDALVFDTPRSTKVRLYSTKTGHGVEMEFGGFRYLGVWSAVGDAPFVALEPWTGCADCTDETGRFEEKRGMTVLAHGESRSWQYRVQLF
jgi:galactose mutarotase-like enzyme